jgi:MFS family permease
MDTTTRPTEHAGHRTSPLINRNYGLLWTGQGISNVGDLIFDTTLVLWIATGLARGVSWAPLAVSGVLLAVLIPSVLSGPLAGVFVDRWDKRRTMLCMDALRAVLIVALLPLTGLLPVAGIHPSVAWQLGCIYAIVVLTTMCSQFFGPARVALIGDIVTEEERSRASSLGQMTQHLATLVGPPLAGPVFFTLGARWALVANAASFAFSFAMIALIRAPESARSVAVGERGHAWQEARAGLRFFGGNRVLVTITVSAVLIMLGAGALNALDIFFVTQNLHTNASLYGIMSAALGSGALLGAILVSMRADRLNMARVFWVSMILTPALMTVFSRLTSFTPALFVLFLEGIPMAALNIAVMPLILQVTPREMIGRVTGVLQPAINLASVIGIGLAGLLAGTVLHGFHAQLLGMTFGPTDSIFTAAGVLGLIAGVYAMFGLRGVANQAQAPATGDAAETEGASA